MAAAIARAAARGSGHVAGRRRRSLPRLSVAFSSPPPSREGRAGKDGGGELESGGRSEEAAEGGGEQPASRGRERRSASACRRGDGPSECASD